MIKALLDTNVLLDFLMRRDSYEDAASILDLASEREFKAYASAHEMTTVAYFLEKNERTRGQVRQNLSVLLGVLQILPVDQKILEDALHSRISDYEDAVLEIVSLKHGVEFVVTRNMKDFTHSKVEAVNPRFFLKLIQKKPPGDMVKEPAPSYRTRPRRRTRKKQS